MNTKLELCDTYEQYVAQCRALVTEGYWITEFSRAEWEEAKRRAVCKENENCRTLPPVGEK